MRRSSLLVLFDTIYDDFASEKVLLDPSFRAIRHAHARGSRVVGNGRPIATIKNKVSRKVAKHAKFTKNGKDLALCRGTACRPRVSADSDKGRASPTPTPRGSGRVREIVTAILNSPSAGKPSAWMEAA